MRRCSCNSTYTLCNERHISRRPGKAGPMTRAMRQSCCAARVTHETIPLHLDFSSSDRFETKSYVFSVETKHTFRRVTTKPRKTPLDNESSRSPKTTSRFLYCMPESVYHATHMLFPRIQKRAKALRFSRQLAHFGNYRNLCTGLP